MRQPIERAGYSWLINALDLRCVPLDHECVIGSRQALSQSAGGVKIEVFAKGYAREHRAIDQMLFALSYEGVNLGVLERAFQIPAVRDELAASITEKPASGYLRRLWYICENIAGHQLPLPDAAQNIPYEHLLPPERYFTGPEEMSRRHRVRMNLLGTPKLSALISRQGWTDDSLLNEQIVERMHDQMVDFSVAEIARAAQYLLTTETRSSYEIEHERPAPDRILRFVKVLEQAGQRPLDEEFLFDIHRIALGTGRPDPSIGAYRYLQNWLGRGDLIHLLPPAPEAVPEMMDEWFAMRERIMRTDAPALVKLNAIAHSFIYIHPFMDGNGRLSRFIMQDILANEGLKLQGIILPISAGLLVNLESYVGTLDALSRRLLSATQYHRRDLASEPELDEAHAHLFAHLDFTDLQGEVNKSAARVLDGLMRDEVNHLIRRDRFKEQMNRELDLSNRDLELLIAVMYENRGRVSKRKRTSVFQHLTDDDIALAESIYTDLHGPEELE
ncbi:MAG: Fic family protein [Tritonibacter mobilis]|uniref:Fic family protein n=1 Tax=Halopseudomonas sp. TaxID=2901191 RepID=UPI0030016C08|nr:Fic family protein [Tritonibacter mobilis]